MSDRNTLIHQWTREHFVIDVPETLRLVHVQPVSPTQESFFLLEAMHKDALGNPSWQTVPSGSWDTLLAFGMKDLADRMKA